MEAVVITGSSSLSPRYSANNSNPMVIVHGRPVLAHQLEYWVHQGVDRFIICIGKTTPGIREYFSKQFRGAEIDYIVEQRPLGSGGALLAASRLLLDDTFLLVSANSFAQVPLTAFKEAHRKRKSGITCAAVPANGNANRGVAVDANHRILFSGDKKPTARLTGNYLIQHELFGKLPFHSGDYFTIEGTLLPAASVAGVKVTTFEVPGIVLEPVGEDTAKLAADVFGSLSMKAA